MKTYMFNPGRESASRATLEAIQTENFKNTLKRIWDNIPLYRARMNEVGLTPDDIHSIQDLHKLPFTYKQDLRETYPFGMFAVPHSQIVRLHASSGTTGKQIVVGYTKKDIESWSECVARSLTAAGTYPGDKVHISYGYGLFTGGLGLHYGTEMIGATAIPVSTGNTVRQIQLLQDFEPSVLCGTPSYALHLIDCLREQNIPLSSLQLRVGIFGAEPWTDAMRAEIEKGLGLKAFDIYGLTEITGPGVSFNCAYQNGLHVNEDYFVPEIIDPETGMPLPPGEYGELVFTCVAKEAFPLIRYRTRDIACLDYAPCACGRTLVRMSKPHGRSDDMLIIRGINVFPSQIESVLLGMGETSPHYLLIVDRINNLDTLEVQIEVTHENFRTGSVKHLENLAKAIKTKLESVLSISAKITLVEPNTLPRTDGKAKHVIDKRQLL